MADLNTLHSLIHHPAFANDLGHRSVYIVARLSRTEIRETLISSRVVLQIEKEDLDEDLYSERYFESRHKILDDY